MARKTLKRRSEGISPVGEIAQVYFNSVVVSEVYEEPRRTYGCRPDAKGLDGKEAQSERVAKLDADVLFVGRVNVQAFDDVVLADRFHARDGG